MKNTLSAMPMKSMRNSLWFKIGMGCLLLASRLVFAADVQSVGHIELEIPALQSEVSTSTKTITLDTYELSDKAQRGLEQRMRRRLTVEQMPRQFITKHAHLLPRSVQLGMGNVPVLDQGRHGACVIFAATASVDATLNRGKYISQLCLLQLGRYFEKNTSWQSSGWDGLHSSQLVFDRMNQYGVISIENQQHYGCGGVFAYPYEEDLPESDMPLATYLQYREMLPKNQIVWSSVWSGFWFDFTSDTVMKAKEALSKGNRLVVGTLLPRVYLGQAGASGKNHTFDDTWVLTPEIEQGISWFKKIPGHAMIVTGYDDKAVAVDRSGNLHRGLFTLRSSWGPRVGDAGDFYMSYDYFEMLVVEAMQIGLVK
ncbi:MAG: C1 family peptidase [Legionellales bacterium]|nr:C1 family peptidase [Legionellales bacterium]